MAKRTFQEVFLDTLLALAASTPNGRVSGSALEARLAWTVDGRYLKIRQQLIREGKIRAYPGGAGGSLEPVRAAIPAGPKPLKAFISYSHVDLILKEELRKHLQPLRRLGIVESWHDGDISAGDKWEEAILSSLRGADLVILLITADFINSEYCYDKELSEAVERHNAKQTRIIPVVGRNCLWHDLPFGQIQAALRGKAVASQPDIDEALTEIAKEIKNVALELRSARLPA